jgi:hypothetical protein
MTDRGSAAAFTDTPGVLGSAAHSAGRDGAATWQRASEAECGART